MREHVTNFLSKPFTAEGSKSQSVIKVLGLADWGCFKNVAVSDVPTVLLSESALRRQGARVETVEPSGDKHVWGKHGEHLLTAKFNGYMWPISLPVRAEFQVPGTGACIFQEASLAALLVGGTPKNRAQAAHERLGHVSYSVLKLMNANGAFTPKIPLADFKTVLPCDGCAAGKSVSASAPKCATRKATYSG